MARTQCGAEARWRTDADMESEVIAHDMTVHVKWTRRGRTYTAELCFAADDHAVLDAGSRAELEVLVELAVCAGVLARKLRRPARRLRLALA